MNAFIVTQLGPPQPGWGLQHTLDLQPSGARTYEPKALVTHTSATNIELLIRFYDLTGETKFLARIPEAIDWLDKLALAARRRAAGPHASDVRRARHERAAVRPSRRIERRSTAATYVDKNPKGHDRPLQLVPPHRCRRAAQAVRDGEEHAARRSGQDVAAEARRRQGAAGEYYTVTGNGGDAAKARSPSLNAEGYWLAPLGYNSHPYKTRWIEGAAARRLFADLRRRRDRHVAVSGSEVDGHFDRGLHSQHGRADSRARSRRSNATRRRHSSRLRPCVASAAAQPRASGRCGGSTISSALAACR